MNLTLDQSLTVPAEVIYRELDNEAVLLDLRSGIYFGLDPVGTRIWQLIVDRRALTEVLNVLVDEFAADRQLLERDLLELGSQLCAKGLAEVAPITGS